LFNTLYLLTESLLGQRRIRLMGKQGSAC